MSTYVSNRRDGKSLYLIHPDFHILSLTLTVLRSTHFLPLHIPYVIYLTNSVSSSLHPLLHHLLCCGTFVVFWRFFDRGVVISPGLLHPEQQDIRPQRPCHQSQSESHPLTPSHLMQTFLLSLYSAP